jgi:hypothetical protein
MLHGFRMALFTKSRKILISDVPPAAKYTTQQGLVIAWIGAFCASVVLAAVLFVFLGT